MDELVRNCIERLEPKRPAREPESKVTYTPSPDLEIKARAACYDDTVPRKLDATKFKHAVRTFGKKRLESAYLKIREEAIQYRASAEYYSDFSRAIRVRNQLQSASNAFKKFQNALLEALENIPAERHSIWNTVATESLSHEYAARLVRDLCADNYPNVDLPKGPEQLASEFAPNVAWSNSFAGAIENIGDALKATTERIDKSIPDGNNSNYWRQFSIEAAVLIWVEHFGESADIKLDLPTKRNGGLAFLIETLKTLWTKSPTGASSLEPEISRGRTELKRIIDDAEIELRHRKVDVDVDFFNDGKPISRDDIIKRARRLFQEKWDNQIEQLPGFKLTTRDPMPEDVSDAEFVAEFGCLHWPIGADLRRY
ncbi:hypothetical protein [Hyphobacterium sp.]|uniref:hypothetical protein n=1 Tax=Hyphobacterium sp. TaxID=2004662 RepID=UPI003BA899A7